MRTASLNLPSWRGTLYQIDRVAPVSVAAYVRSKKPRLLVGGKETWLPARIEVAVLEESLTVDEARCLAYALSAASDDVRHFDTEYPAGTEARPAPPPDQTKDETNASDG
jgi:hypothetical protein